MVEDVYAYGASLEAACRTLQKANFYFYWSINIEKYNFCEGQTPRYFNGYCFTFSLQRVENGLAVYQLVLKPWLAFFSLRSDHYLFHQQNIREQSTEIFTDSGLSNHEFRVRDADLKRTFSCQYDETDHNYLHRRWEEMGWLYWYEHKLDSHKLIISDTSRSAEPVAGKSTLALHHDGGSNRSDKIHAWSPVRKLVSGKVTLASFDFKKPTPQVFSEASTKDQGDMHQIEVYQYQDLFGFKDNGHAEFLARVRMEQIDAQALQFHAKSNARYVQPGRWFQLHQDFDGQIPSAGENEYFILSVKHVVDNNFLNAKGNKASYENEFVCVPRNLAWRPPQGFSSEAVKIRGSDTAIVVGAGQGDIFTDRYGRIRVQFHWDREGVNTEASSAWIRVASNWAGAELGAIAIPRVGSEVVVQWLGGSPDRPLVTGSVYNARKMPPWKLPSQQALMGLRSNPPKLREVCIKWKYFQYIQTKT